MMAIPSNALLSTRMHVCIARRVDGLWRVEVDVIKVWSPVISGDPTSALVDETGAVVVEGRQAIHIDERTLVIDDTFDTEEEAESFARVVAQQIRDRTFDLDQDTTDDD